LDNVTTRALRPISFDYLVSRKVSLPNSQKRHISHFLKVASSLDFKLEIYNVVIRTANA